MDHIIELWRCHIPRVVLQSIFIKVSVQLQSISIKFV